MIPKKPTSLNEPVIVAETLPFGADADPTLAMPCPIEDGIPDKVAEMLETRDAKMEGSPDKRPEPSVPEPPTKTPEKASQVFSWIKYTLLTCDQKS